MALLFSQPTGYLIMYYSGELSQISLHSRAYVRIVDKGIQDSHIRFWIPRGGFRIPGTGFPIFFQLNLRVRIPIVRGMLHVP